MASYSGSGWNEYRALSVRMLTFPPAKTRGHTRQRLMSLSRLSKWLGCGQDTQDLAFSLLSMALSNPINPDWARTLLEAVPTCGRKAIQDLVLMEHLGRPKAGDESNWQWTLQRLTQDCLSTEDGYIVHSFNTYKHAKTLLALAYLWHAGDKRWVGDEVSRHQVEWMSQHHERLTRSEEATIDTFLVDWRRAGLMAVADGRKSGQERRMKM